MTTEGDPAPSFILDEAKLRPQKIVHLAKKRAIDWAGHRLHLDDGSELPYAKLFVAKGARPRRLLVPGADGLVLYLRTVADALALRKRLRPRSRLVVIGGVFIGLEIAAGAVGRAARSFYWTRRPAS